MLLNIENDQIDLFTFGEEKPVEKQTETKKEAKESKKEAKKVTVKKPNAEKLEKKYQEALKWCKENNITEIEVETEKPKQNDSEDNSVEEAEGNEE